jgi:hypothetical protein
MVFIGAEWVSASYDRSNQSSSFKYQVSKVMGLIALYHLHFTKLSLQIHILAEIKQTS